MTHIKKQIPSCFFPAGVFLLTTTLAFAQAPIFKAAQTYSVGSIPSDIAVGDFNGDGKMDLAVANEGDSYANDAGSISILLGNGDGTFQPAINLTLVKNPMRIAAGDFNGDGKDDLAVTAWVASNNLSIFLSNGDGTFRAGTPAALPGAPMMTVVADFNSDHILDLAVVTDSSINVLLGNGDGTFRSQFDYGITNPTFFLVAADLNGDGILDLYNLYSIFIGKGDGTFTAISTINLSPGYGPTGAIGDFNHDGYLDLVGQGAAVECSKDPIKYCPGPIGVFLGTAGGSFQAGASIASNGFSAFLLAGDFDGDGNIDAVASDSIEGTAGSQIAVFLGNGDGTFRDAALFAAGGLQYFSPLVAADLNGDKAPDLIAAGSQYNNSIAVLVNTGPDFTISASALNPNTLSAGQSAISSVSLKALRDFGTPVSLSCVVQPAQPGGPSCSLSSSSVTFDANREASATLTISAGSIAASVNSPRPFGTGGLLWLPVAGFAYLGTRSRVNSSRRRRRLMLPMSAVYFIGIIMLAACSSSGPKPTAYSIMIAGASGATQHSATVNLTVR